MVLAKRHVKVKNKADICGNSAIAGVSRYRLRRAGNKFRDADMKCPDCGAATHVIDRRGARRRRECLNVKCGARFSTDEIVVETGAKRPDKQRTKKRAAKRLTSAIGTPGSGQAHLSLSEIRRRIENRAEIKALNGGELK